MIPLGLRPPSPLVQWLLDGACLGAAGFLTWQVCRYPWLRPVQGNPGAHPYVPHARITFWVTALCIAVNLLLAADAFGWVRRFLGG
jgi:hypothetical protein